MPDWWICPAGHSVDSDFKPVHELCGQPARRHPQVTYYNAISSAFERICYTTAGEAFGQLITHRPYNNTNPSASWCDLAHCPHGCRTAGWRDQPVIQNPLSDTAGGLPVPTGRFRCPNCLSEYTPGVIRT